MGEMGNPEIHEEIGIRDIPTFPVTEKRTNHTWTNKILNGDTPIGSETVQKGCTKFCNGRIRGAYEFRAEPHGPLFKIPTFTWRLSPPLLSSLTPGKGRSLGEEDLSVVVCISNERS